VPIPIPVRSLGRRLVRQARRARTQWVADHLRPYSQVFYVVESFNWAIAYDGRYITAGVRRAGGIPERTVRSALGLHHQVVHYGSRNLYMLGGYRDADPSNRAVMTWYHGHPGDPKQENQAMIAALAERAAGLEAIVTASSISQKRLIGWGVPEAKLIRVPIGIDLRLFKPASPAARAEARRRLGLAPDQICLGLFHKDGEGWGEGLQPKWVKAPDVFLQVVERLHARYPLFVLLTGPARGFVKQGLQRLGVPHRHLQLASLAQVAPLYHALDVYIIPSREEGGPKALLECLASGVPVVSTRVGMCVDVIRDGENGFLADAEDAEGLAQAAGRLIDAPPLRQAFVERGLADVTAFEWAAVSAQYCERVYQPLLSRA
jgi:glycosyltransferase involved in cell wall biosynthesis